MTLAVRVYGSRGSIPVCGSENARVGGNTSCVRVTAGERTIIFDAGSGLVNLGRDLMSEGVKRADLFLTHPHYDHLIGLPFFAPLMNGAVSLEIWSQACTELGGACDILDAYIRPPFSR